MDNANIFALSVISEDDIRVKKAKKQKIFKPDAIPPYIYKDYADFFVKPFYYMFNLCIKYNSFPEV